MGLAQGLSPQSVPRRRWRIACLLGFGVLVNYFDRINLSVAHEALHSEFGISVEMFGVLLSAYMWTYALCQIPVGVLLDRMGVKKIGRLGAFIWSMGSFAAAASAGLWMLFPARFLLGVGEAPTFPANSKAIGYWFPNRERSLSTAIFDSAAKFASAIGVPIVGFLMVHFGWRWSFFATGCASFGYFLMFYFFYRNPSEDPKLTDRERRYIVEGGAQPEDLRPRQPEEGGRGAPLGYLITKRKVIGLSLGFAAYNYTFYLLLTWMPDYLSKTMHISLLRSAMYTSVPWLIATVTDLGIGGLLVDALLKRGWNGSKVRQVVLVVGMMFGVGIFGVASAKTPHQAVFWISVSLAGLAAAAPVAWSIPSLIAPRESVGRIGGIINFFSQMAGISAPIITGFVVAVTHSFHGAFVSAAVFLVVGIVGYVFLLGKIEAIPEPVQG
jgi:ACS family D-galactonate transporter-like MFS transporter